MTEQTKQPPLVEMPARPDEVKARQSVPFTSIVPPAAAEFTPASRELINDIRARGILEPLLLRPVPGDENRFFVVGGRRRFDATRTALAEAQRDGDTGTCARLHNVPAVILNISELEAAAMSARVHSLRSENLLADIETMKLMAKYGASELDIRRMTSWTRQSFGRRISLVRLSVNNPELYSILEKGQMTVTVAEKIAKLLPDAKQRLLEIYLDRVHRESQPDGKPESIRITETDLKAVKSVQVANALATMPESLFSDGGGSQATFQQPGTPDEMAANGAQMAAGAPELFAGLAKYLDGQIDAKERELAHYGQTDAHVNADRARHDLARLQRWKDAISAGQPGALPPVTVTRVYDETRVTVEETGTDGERRTVAQTELIAPGGQVSIIGRAIDPEEIFQTLCGELLEASFDSGGFDFRREVEPQERYVALKDVSAILRRIFPRPE